MSIYTIIVTQVSIETNGNLHLSELEFVMAMVNLPETSLWRKSKLPKHASLTVNKYFSISWDVSGNFNKIWGWYLH